jgi:hypothetical protein
MKYLLALLVFSSFSNPSYALASAAGKTVPEILQIVNGANFTYRGKAILSGYSSTESCLYTSDEIAVLVNYCGKSKTYPARSITIMSRDFGLLRFYEEKIDQDFYRVIRLNVFNGELKSVLPIRAADITLAQADQSYALLSDFRLPVCWSSNQVPGDGCNAFDMKQMSDWHSANKIYFSSQSEWNQTFSQILARLPL